MSGQDKPTRFPAWLVPAVVVLFGAQVALLYLQGVQIHRQRSDIRALRQDVRDLTEAVDQAMYYEEGSFQPGRHRASKRKAFQRVILEEGPEPAAKELEAARKSAEKAVEQARETQQKVSIEENARKAEEKAKVEAAQHKWGRYVGLGFVVALLAILGRSFLRRNTA